MKFDDLPGHSRLWVHTADRDLLPQEQELLMEDLKAFLSNWSAHGSALHAAGTVLYNRVLVVGMDERQAGATGCSIDKLVAFVRRQGESRGIDWFDRHQVLWRQPKAEGWEATRTSEFWAMRKAGLVTDRTEVVDPLAATVGDAESEGGWLVKSFDESWHSAMWS